MNEQRAAATVEFDGVTKQYGNVTAVRDVRFTITAGSLVTLLGPSGCGKTTTLRLIAGLEMVSSGRILIGGVDVTRRPATDRDVTMVFQSYALFPHMSVAENVSYGLRVGGMPPDSARECAQDGLAMVGLQGFDDRLPSELSGGQQQRVALARALVLEPQVLLFDEPLSNLDAKLRRQVREDIRDLQRELGVTSVYVTHDQQEALAVSDRIIVMDQAVVAQDGSPRELYEEPASAFVANFIGDANLVGAEIQVGENDTRARVALGTAELDLPRRGLPAGPAQVAIRPEAIRLTRADANTAMKGTVRKAVYLGSHIEYAIESELGELFVVDPRVEHVYPSGSDVALSFASHGVTLVRDS